MSGRRARAKKTAETALARVPRTPPLEGEFVDPKDEADDEMPSGVQVLAGLVGGFLGGHMAETGVAYGKVHAAQQRIAKALAELEGIPTFQVGDTLSRERLANAIAILKGTCSACGGTGRKPVPATTFAGGYSAAAYGMESRTGTCTVCNGKGKI